MGFLTTTFFNSPGIRHWRPFYKRDQADVYRCHIVCSIQWPPIRKHTNSLLGASGVSVEYWPLCFVSPPIPALSLAKTSWYKDRMIFTSHIGCGQCRWRGNFVTIAAHHYKRSHPPVRTGVSCPTQPAKIEGPCGRKTVYTSDHLWDLIPSLCVHIRRPILGHYWVNDERHVGACSGKSKLQARRAYAQDPWLASRMRYVNTFLLSKIW